MNSSSTIRMRLPLRLAFIVRRRQVQCLSGGGGIWTRSRASRLKIASTVSASKSRQRRRGLGSPAIGISGSFIRIVLRSAERVHICGASLVVRSLMIPLLSHNRRCGPLARQAVLEKEPAGASAYATGSRCCRARGICACGMNVGPASRLRSHQDFDRLSRSISRGLSRLPTPIAAREARARKRRRLWRREPGSARRRRSSAFAPFQPDGCEGFLCVQQCRWPCRVTDDAPGRGAKGNGTALIAGLGGTRLDRQR